MEAGGGPARLERTGDPRMPLVQALLASLMRIYETAQERVLQREAGRRQMSIAEMQMKASERQQRAENDYRNRALQQAAEFHREEMGQKGAELAQRREERAPQEQLQRLGIRGQFAAELPRLQQAIQQAAVEDLPLYIDQAKALVDQAQQARIDIGPDLRPLIHQALQRLSGENVAPGLKSEVSLEDWQGSAQKSALDRINELKVAIGDKPVELVGLSRRFMPDIAAPNLQPGTVYAAPFPVYPRFGG